MVSGKTNMINKPLLQSFASDIEMKGQNETRWQPEFFAAMQQIFITQFYQVHRLNVTYMLHKGNM